MENKLNYDERYIGRDHIFIIEPNSFGFTLCFKCSVCGRKILQNDFGGYFNEDYSFITKIDCNEYIIKSVVE